MPIRSLLPVRLSSALTTKSRVVREGGQQALAEELLHLHPHAVAEQVGVGDEHQVDCRPPTPRRAAAAARRRRAALVRIAGSSGSRRRRVAAGERRLDLALHARGDGERLAAGRVAVHAAAPGRQEAEAVGADRHRLVASSGGAARSVVFAPSFGSK